MLQPTGAFVQVSPSVFMRARATGETAASRPGEFFKCPVCGEAVLERGADHLRCSHCQRRWAFLDGIYDFKESI